MCVSEKNELPPRNLLSGQRLPSVNKIIRMIELCENRALANVRNMSISHLLFFCILSILALPNSTLCDEYLHLATPRILNLSCCPFCSIPRCCPSGGYQFTLLSYFISHTKRIVINDVPFH